MEAAEVIRQHERSCRRFIVGGVVSSATRPLRSAVSERLR
jgi:hypothetical protein